MTKILKNLCNSLGITEDSLPNKKRFGYKGIEERKQLTDPIRHDEKLNYLVVSQYTQLKKVGNQYFGLCPLHEETESSFTFSILNVGLIFHCFGCEAKGDLIDLTRHMENMKFSEAMQILWVIKMKLDPTAKIPILESQRKKKGSNKILRSIKGQAPTVSPKSDRKSSNLLYSGSKTLQIFLEGEIEERRLNTCRFITKFCLKHLLSNDPDAQNTLKYLIEERGLTVKMIYERGISFCQKKAMFPGDSLMNYKFSCSIEHVNKILPLDLFEEHILFPIRDPKTGDVVSFQARRVGEDGQGEKHITKNNECYTKNENLHLLYEAIDAIQDKGYVFIVEGALYALHMHQAGYMNTVALLGNRISDEQIALIENSIAGKDYKTKCLTDVFLFLDADKGGIDASKEIYEKFKKVGLSVKSFTLNSSWKDPASLMNWLQQEKFSHYDDIVKFSFDFPICSKQGKVLQLEEPSFISYLRWNNLIYDTI